MEQGYASASDEQSVKRADRDAAITIITEILQSHTLTEDSLKGWPDSDDATVNKIGKTIRGMAKTLKKCFYRDMSCEVPFFMLKQLQNMQMLLMGDYKAKPHRYSFLRTLAAICFVLGCEGIIVWGILFCNYRYLLEVGPSKFPINFGVLVLAVITRYLFDYLKKPIWPADKPIYWPFKSKKQYYSAKEKFSDKVTNPEYLKNHRFAGLYAALLEKEPLKPFNSDRVNLLMVLDGCPISRCLPEANTEKCLEKIRTLLTKVCKKYGNNSNSPYTALQQRAEFFLTTQKEYGELKPFYSDSQQLAYTFVSVLFLGVVIAILAVIKVFPESVLTGWGFGVFIVITLGMLISPTIYTNYKTGQKMLKDVVEIPYWPFASQEDFDASQEEYPQTAYLLERKENGWTL